VVKTFQKGTTKTFSNIPDPDICHNLTKFPDNFSLTDLPIDLDCDYSKYSQWMANKGIVFKDESEVEVKSEKEQERKMEDLEEMVDSLVSEIDESVVDEEIEIENDQESIESIGEEEYVVEQQILGDSIPCEQKSEVYESLSETEDKVSEFKIEDRTVRMYQLKG
jgi:hypothetical protein